MSNKDLYQYAVLERTEEDTTLLVEPTWTLAPSKEVAEMQAIRSIDGDIDESNLDVLVRSFGGNTSQERSIVNNNFVQGAEMVRDIVIETFLDNNKGSYIVECEGHRVLVLPVPGGKGYNPIDLEASGNMTEAGRIAQLAFAKGL